jgi:hypothetical protein
MRNGSALGIGASWLGFSTAAAIALSGCSAKSSAPYPDVTSFCTAKAQAECQIAATCGFTSPTDCVTQRTSICNDDANQAASTGSHTRKYTQANAPACIDRVNGLYGNNASMIAYNDLVGPGSLTDVCERVFSGSAAFNQSCQSTYDCADSHDECVPISPGSMALVCAPTTKVAAGALCQNAGSVCETDTYCAPSTTVAPSCMASMQEGQSCETVPCVSSQRCLATGVTGHTCEARVAENQPCTTSDDCLSAAPYCDPYANNVCRPGLSFGFGSFDCTGFASKGAVAVAVPEAGSTD